MYKAVPGREIPEWGERSLFGIWHEFTECSEEGWVTPWFTNEDERGRFLATGEGGLHRLAFDIASIENGSIGQEQTLRGRMIILKDNEGATLGHFEGFASTPIASYSTQEITGTGEVLAHAFHFLP